MVINGNVMKSLTESILDNQENIVGKADKAAEEVSIISKFCKNRKKTPEMGVDISNKTICPGDYVLIASSGIGVDYRFDLGVVRGIDIVSKKIYLLVSTLFGPEEKEYDLKQTAKKYIIISKSQARNLL